MNFFACTFLPATTFMFFQNAYGNFHAEIFPCFIIKLLQRFINILAAIFSLEALQVSLDSSYHFKSKLIAIGLTPNLMQINSSRVVNCELASHLARSLRSGDHIR